MESLVKNQPGVEWIPKKWGGELILVNKEQYCCKILNFVKGARLSVHYHLIKDETFWLKKGKLHIYYTDNVPEFEYVMKQKSLYGKNWQEANGYLNYLDSFFLEPGDTFYVPPGRAHQMIALEQSELIEVSTQDFPEDSYRIILGDHL